MTNAELIDSLRNVYGEKADCYHCHSNMGCYGTACMEYLCHDAADALEAAELRIAELEDEIKNLENAYIAELTQAHINVQRSAKIYREWYEAVGSKRGKDNERA